MTMQISYKLASDRRTTPFQPTAPLGFGEVRTDHVFVLTYKNGEWMDPRIVPYNESPLDTKTGIPLVLPGSKINHYGYSIFEGAKAHPYRDGEIATFRLRANAERLNRSARIMCMPTIPEEIVMEATHALLDLERRWMPIGDGNSLYIRPYIVQSRDSLGPSPGKETIFTVFLSPSGPYFSQGFEPTTLLVQDLFFRSFSGGVGAAKAGGNYGGVARAMLIAELCGAKQCLFVSPSGNIEEVGTSGFGMIQEGRLCLPQLTDTILDSITVRSVEQLVRERRIEGVSQVERKSISLDDLLRGLEEGSVTEVMGLGTAAVVAPVGELRILDANKLDPERIRMLREGLIYPNELFVGNPENYLRNISINDRHAGPITKGILDTYTAIQTGKIDGPEGWVEVVERRMKLEK